MRYRSILTQLALLILIVLALGVLWRYRPQPRSQVDPPPSSGLPPTPCISEAQRPSILRTPKTYSTSFASSEGVISEDGRWMTGKADALDWTDVRTERGLAFGLQSGTNQGRAQYDDSMAFLTGEWAPNQSASATVRSLEQDDGVYEEVELVLRGAMAPHCVNAYEINFRCSKAATAYAEVVRWNGALGEFTYLTRGVGAEYGVADGASTVRVITNDVLLPEPALTLADARARLVGLAIDSAYLESHAVFVAWTELTRSGETVLTVGRYREVANTLGEGAVIVTGLPIPADTRAPMAVGRDELVYLALPGASRDDRSVPFGGLVLRFDRDGATPRANPRLSPVIARGYTSPIGLAVDEQVWLAGEVDESPSTATINLTQAQQWPAAPSIVGSQVAQSSPFDMRPFSDSSPVTVAAVGRGRWYVATRTIDGHNKIVRLQTRF